MTASYNLVESKCPALRALGLGLLPETTPDTERALQWVERQLPWLPEILIKDDRIVPRFMRRKTRTVTWPIYDELDSLCAVGDRAAEARILEEVRKLDPSARSVTIAQRELELFFGNLFHEFVVEIIVTFGPTS